MVEYKLKQKLLKVISESLIFSDNSIYNFIIENDSDIGTVTMLLNELINENKVLKMYYCPYEERTANEPIGTESYQIFIITFDKANFQRLMDYNETN